MRKTLSLGMSGIAAGLAAAASGLMSGVGYNEHPHARYYGRNPSHRVEPNPAGSKLGKKAAKGTVGQGMHRKRPIESVTFSPKKDIGKGPAFTEPRSWKRKIGHLAKLAEKRRLHLA